MAEEVTSVKNWKGRDGIGYQATLVFAGVKTAIGTDEGNGGCMRWDVLDVERFQMWAAAHGVPEPFETGRVVKCDTPLDMLFAELVDRHEQAKTLRKWCKRSTVFRLPTDKEGTYRTLNRPYTVGVRATVLDKHPDAIILNELYS